MNSSLRASLRARSVFVAFALVSGACASSRRDPLVPEDMQQRSKERYGEQQMSLESLNQTPAEQASTYHHRDTAPRDPKSEETPDGRDSGD